MICLSLTGTSGPGPQRRSGGSGASLKRSGQQNTDLVLRVRIQVADLVRGLVHGLQVVHCAGHGAVLHLPINDGAVSVDGVGVQLNPEVSGANGSQLGGSDRHRGLCGNTNVAIDVYRKDKMVSGGKP